MKLSNTAMQWVELASQFIPDMVKSHNWRMWEYRTLHKGLSRIYGPCFAYELSKVLLNNYQLFSGLKDDAGNPD